MREIIYKFVEQGINISPEAYEKIIQLKNPLIFTRDLILNLRSNFSKKELFILDKELLMKYLDEDENNEGMLNEDKKDYLDADNKKKVINEKSANESTVNDRKHAKKFKNIKNSQENKDANINNKTDLKKINKIIKSGELNKVFDPLKSFRNLNSCDVDYDFKIIQDTSGKSYTCGEISNLVSYFNNRFEKLSNILSRRPDFKISQKINDIIDTNEFNIIAMIKEIKTNKNGHKFLEIEDDTGDISIFLSKDNKDLFLESEKLVKDEVIGIVGEKKGKWVIGSKLIHPGVHRLSDKQMDFSIAFTSDIHIGSLNFLDDAFSNFIKWINGDYGNEEQRVMGNDIKYLIIAGDIVDGIGIYPNQDKELAIKDINQQYEIAASYLGDIRSDVKIILTPGNHDASRVAEPQPAIPEKYAKSLYQLNNLEILSNPARVNLDGFDTLIYHGRGFDDLAMSVKGMSHDKNDLLMEEMLKKRHLAPIYGERTPLASELEDYLVIDKVPDILHTGHVHINKYKQYNGIHLINSGTFQTQTEFQKIYNIVPTSGIVPILYRGKYKELNFFN
jgi:DNA polymerase II small subunit